MNTLQIIHCILGIAIVAIPFVALVIAIVREPKPNTETDSFTVLNSNI